MTYFPFTIERKNTFLSLFYFPDLCAKDFILVIQYASSLFEGKFCGRCIFTKLSDIFPLKLPKGY